MTILVEIGASAAKLAPSKVEEVLANAWVSENAHWLFGQILLLWSFFPICHKLAIAWLVELTNWFSGRHFDSYLKLTFFLSWRIHNRAVTSSAVQKILSFFRWQNFPHRFEPYLLWPIGFFIVTMNRERWAAKRSSNSLKNADYLNIIVTMNRERWAAKGSSNSFLKKTKKNTPILAWI